MIFFITVLRALAAMLITNSHYVGVYPTDVIANGGLYGDVIFFAVSGFCLANVKDSFMKWYGKRLLRVYPATILISAIYCTLRLFPIALTPGGVVSMFLYPTTYHFVSSIVLLYIPFYFVMKVQYLRDRLPAVFGVVGVIWLLFYFLGYDKSFYHIDTVREPMIRFLFFFAMLIGAYFRINRDRFLNQKTTISWVLWIFSLGVYFASKIGFSKNYLPAEMQFINQIFLLVLLFFTMRCFSSIDDRLEKMPKVLKRCITFISEITLEIYLVQIPLIKILNVFPFPLNWLFITSVILLLAFLLHIVIVWTPKGVRKLLYVFKARN